MEHKHKNPSMNFLILPPIKEAATAEEASSPMSPYKNKNKSSVK